MTQRYNTWAVQRASEISGQPSSVSSRQMSTQEKPNFVDYIESKQQQSVYSQPKPSFTEYMESQKPKQSYDPEAARASQEKIRYTVRGEQGQRNIERLEQEQDYFSSRVLNEPELAMSIAPEKQTFTPYSTMPKEKVRDIGQKEYESERLIYQSEFKENEPKIKQYVSETEKNRKEILDIAKKYNYSEDKKTGQITILEPVSDSDYYKLVNIQESQKEQREKFSEIEPFLSKSDRMRELGVLASDIGITKQKMYEVEASLPENIAREKLAKKYEDISPYLTDSGDLTWQTKFLMLPGVRDLPFVKRDEKINEFVEAQKRYEETYSKPEKTIYGKNSFVDISIKDVGINTNKFRTFMSMEQQETYKQSLKEYKFSPDRLAEQTAEQPWEYTKILGTVALAATPAPTIGGLGGAALGFGRSYLQWKVAEQIISTSYEAGARIKTAINTGDTSYLYKDISKYKGQYLQASEAEQAALGGIGGAINKYVPQLRDPESRVLIGSAIAGLSYVKGSKIGTGVGLAIAGTAVPIKPVREIFSREDVFKQSLAEQGLSGSEIEFLAETKKAKGISSTVSLAVVSTQSEILGERIYGVGQKLNPSLGLSTKIGAKEVPRLYGIFPTSEAFRVGYKSAGTAMYTAGTFEGIATAEIQAKTELREPTILERAGYGAIGGISARTIGGYIIGASAARKTITKAGLGEKFAMTSVYLTDTSEYIGDVTASEILATARKRFGVDVTESFIRKGTSKDTVDIFGVTLKGERQPIRVATFTDVPLQESNFQEAYSKMTIDPRTSIYTPSDTETYIQAEDVSTTRTNIVKTPTTINIPVTQPVSIPVQSPVSSPVQSPISTPVSVPVTTNIPVNTAINVPVSQPISAFTALTNVPAFSYQPVSVPEQVTFPVSSPINLPIQTPINTEINVGVNMPVITPVSVVVPKLPIYPVWFGSGGKGKGRKKGGRKTAYSPDFIALVEGITSSKRPMNSFFTGNEIRPIIISNGSFKTRKRK